MQLDVSYTGAAVSVSWRHDALNQLNMRVAARNGVKTPDWCAVPSKLLTSDDAYDAIFVDDYHSNDTGYGNFNAPCAEIADWIRANRGRSDAMSDLTANDVTLLRRIAPAEVNGVPSACSGEVLVDLIGAGIV